MIIERVAKAIAIGLADITEEVPAMERAARAALDAIAEPTPEMIEAAMDEASYHCWTGLDGSWPITRDEMKSVLRAAHTAMVNS